MNTDYPKDEVEKVKRRAERKAEYDADYPNEEKIGDQPCLHIYGDLADGWSVWLNVEADAVDSGLCIGAGDTRQAAVSDAVQVLERLAEALQAPGPAELDEIASKLAGKPEA